MRQLLLVLHLHLIPHPFAGENANWTLYKPVTHRHLAPASSHPPLPPAWARGEGNFRCISIFLAYCKNAIMADLPPGHAKDDCSLSQNRLWAGLMRPACNWITTPQSASAFPCLSLKLHHAIWLTSERRANTSRFPVNIDNANCPFLGQIARGSEGCHSA